MTGLPSNAWLLADTARKTRGELLEICVTRSEDFRRVAATLTVPKIRDLISAERRLHWDGEGSLFAGQPALPRRSRPGRVNSLCLIPAAEVNDFLRSLPRPEILA